MNEVEDFPDLDEAPSELFQYKNKKAERQEITIQLIIRRNLISPKPNPTLLLSSRSSVRPDYDDDVKALKEAKANEQAKKLLQLTRIHLDRENIVEIDNLAECLGPITHLYLQQNLIRKIENLEFLSSLRFLVLANNRIERVDNLLALRSLRFLDLSNNLIEEFQVDQLPSSLVILDLRGNGCADKLSEYRVSLEARLKNLHQLNGEQLVASQNGMDFRAENEEEDDEKEENAELRLKQDISAMHRIGEDIIERSKLRQKEFEVKSKKDFELMKLQLERSKRELLEKLKQNS